MNVQGTINKLLLAIKQKGKIVKLDTKMFYSEKKDCYVTKYTFSEKKQVEKTDGQKVEKWVEISSCWGKPSLIKEMVDYYYKIGSEADE